MKLFLQSLVFVFATVSFGQTVYTSSDYAAIGDSYRVSQTSLGLNSFDFVSTGADYQWDFSNISISTQETEDWIDPNNAGYKTTWCLSNGYVLNCNTNFNANFNLAIQVLDGIEFNGYGLTNLVNHYQKTTSLLQNKMLGGSISIGAVSVPLAIEYITPDTEYRFPIQYNDNYTGNSQFEIDLNSLGLPIQYSSEGQRTNLVDGWGTLITPFATFSNVLRMKTTFVNNETIISNSGTTQTSRTTISYKWFDPAYGIPVLEVSGDELNGVWIPTSATYIDNQQCLDPVALFGYLPLIPDFDLASVSVNISFINTSTNFDTVHWNFGDGTTSSENNPTHTYTCPGTKQVTLTVTNTFCEPDNVQDITIPVLIIDTQNVFTENVTVNENSLTADRDVQGTTYQWVDCDSNQPIEGETAQVFVPTSNGNYAVILTTNDCQTTSECYSFNTMGENTLISSKPVCYPNPVANEIYTTIDENEIMGVEIYDARGALVSRSLDLKEVKTEVFLVRIVTKNAVYTQKMIRN